jgi:sec-independent protein translocase protein TatA
MFDIGLQEMLVIGVLALLVFGPSKLPELGRMVGRALREFRRASDEFRSTVETNLHINEPDPPPVSSYASTPSEAGPTLPSETEPIAPETSDLPAAVGTEIVEHGEPYCAQRDSRLFHRRDCGWVARIPEAERVYMKTMTEAREQGLGTCPVCEPWEPA